MIKYLIGFIVASALWATVLSLVEIPNYIIYDCGMAEWHPDIPKEVKEECRKSRREQQKKSNEITT